MKTLWITLLLAVSVLAAAQQTGRAMPEFVLQDADGEIVTPEDLRGRPLLLNFWATWCGPCKEELPLFARVDAEAPDLRVFLVNLSEGRQRAVAFLEDLELDLKTAVDPFGGTDRDAEATLDVARRYRVRGMPTTYFVDAEGVVRSVRVGQVLPDALATELAGIGVQWQP